MKRLRFPISAFLALLLLLPAATRAQSRNGGNGPVTPIRVGTVTVNLGIGAGAEYRGNYYNSPFATKAAIEFGLWQAGPGVITLGGAIGGSFSNGGRSGLDDYRARTFVITSRAAWHYGWQVKGLDTYAGVGAGIGFHHHRYKNFSGDQDELIPVLGGFIGASYFVSPKFGFNAEAGNDITRIQAGVIFKLR